MSRHAARWTLRARIRDRFADPRTPGRHSGAHAPLVVLSLDELPMPASARRHVNAAAS